MNLLQIRQGLGILICSAAIVAVCLTVSQASPSIIRSGGGSLWGCVSEGYTYYLRFYSDGTVIGASSTGTPAQVARWLRKPYPNSGRYVQKGSSIRFSVKSTSGTLDYNGTVDGSTIHLNTYSHMNGKHFQEDYVLMRP